MRSVTKYLPAYYPVRKWHIDPNSGIQIES